MKKLLRRLTWGLLTLLIGIAWVLLWVWIFTLLVGPLGWAWANMIQFWGIYLGLFWVTMKSLWIWADLKREDKV